MAQNSYLFIYGRTHELARYEARCVYPHAVFTTLTPECDWVQINESADSIMERLGGIVRVSQELEIIQTMDPIVVAESIAKDQKGLEQEIRFILSQIGNEPLPIKISHQVKEELEKKGLKCRFSIPTAHSMATAAQVSQKKTHEYVFVPMEKGILVTKTLAVQDSTAWSQRDFNRPKSDAKRGMLPLKVARMVANIGAGPTHEAKTFADPFCGMGTILSEGVLLGGIWYGSDVDEVAIAGTEKNLQWLYQKYTPHVPFPTLFTGDAVHLSEKIPENTLDAIITEPYLGNPALGEGKITEKKQIENILKGLEKMYRGCLKDWHKVLKVNGKVIIALPLIQIGEYKQTVKKLIDTCESLGYSIEAGSLEYSRPGAIVKRQFYIFKKVIT